MKRWKLLCVAAVAVLTLTALVGCGETKNDGSTMEQRKETTTDDNKTKETDKDNKKGDGLVNDVVDDAGDATKGVVDGASDAAKDVVDGAENIVNDVTTGGDTRDGNTTTKTAN